MSRTSARFSGRSLPAALLAVVVLVIAMAGTATAANLITGKQIKNNTITTQDVKNGSLTGQDLKNGSVAGADVKNGSIAVADLAAATKNQVSWQKANDQSIPGCFDTTLDDCTALASAALTPGTWAVSGSVTVDNTLAAAPETINRCGLWRGGEELVESRTPLAGNGAPGEAHSISLDSVVVATESNLPVMLKCTEHGGEAINALGATVVAVKVS